LVDPRRYHLALGPIFKTYGANGKVILYT